MRWIPGGESSDIEDRRGEGGGGGFLGGRTIGIGGFLVLAVLSLVFHRNFFALLGGGSGNATSDSVSAGAPAPVASSPEEDRRVQFVSFVLDDAQATWDTIFTNRHRNYQHAKRVL
jgi:predicted metalloprotease